MFSQNHYLDLADGKFNKTSAAELVQTLFFFLEESERTANGGKWLPAYLGTTAQTSTTRFWSGRLLSRI